MAVLKYYDGSDWEPVASALVGPTGATGATGSTGPTGPNPGLTLIKTETFSAAASVNFDNVFSATYDNYFIICETARSTTANVTFRMRSSSTDETGSNYIQQGLRAASAVVSSSTSTGTVGFFNNLSSSAQFYGYQYFFKPFLATKTNILSTNNSAEPVVGVIATEHQLTTSYDGFSLIPSAGNITGTLSIYGMSK
jgi:hypothetical protein